MVNLRKRVLNACRSVVGGPYMSALIIRAVLRVVPVIALVVSFVIVWFGILRDPEKYIMGDSSADLGNETIESGCAENAEWGACDTEKQLVGSTILVVLISISVCFDFIGDKIEEKIEERSLRAVACAGDGKEIAVSIYQRYHSMLLVWWERLVSELTTLGFLAFTLWIFGLSGGYKALDVGVPPAEIKEMVENIHMRLFITMLLLFSCTLTVILSTESRLRRFDKKELRLFKSDGFRRGVHVHEAFALISRKEYTEAQFVLWRERLVRTQNLPADFSFATYVRFATEKPLRELVAVNPSSWIAVSVVEMSVSLLGNYVVPTTTELGCSFAPISLVNVVADSVVLLGICSLFIGVEYMMVSHAAARTVEELEGKRAATRWEMGFEAYMYKAMAAMLFILSHRCVMALRSSDDFPPDSQLTEDGKKAVSNLRSISATLLIGFFFGVVQVGLRKNLWKAAAVFALPPYIDSGDTVIMAHLVRHGRESFYHEGGSDSPGVEHQSTRGSVVVQA